MQAYMWFNLAATQAKLDSQTLWDDPQILIDNAAKRMTQAQLAEAKRLVKEWKPKGRD